MNQELAYEVVQGVADDLGMVCRKDVDVNSFYPSAAAGFLVVPDAARGLAPIKEREKRVRVVVNKDSVRLVVQRAVYFGELNEQCQWVEVFSLEVSFAWGREALKWVLHSVVKAQL